MNQIKLIFSADDAGVVNEIDNGIIDLVNIGMINSAEVLTNYGENGSLSLFNTKRILKETKDSGNPLELGIHLTITSGSPISGTQGLESILDEKGRFISFNKLPSTAKPDAIYREIEAQANVLLNDSKTASKVTHISNHHDALWFYPNYTEQLLKLADKLNLPIRNPHSIPIINSFIYYVVRGRFKMSRGIAKDRKTIKRFYELRKKKKFPGKDIKFKSTHYFNSKIYSTMSHFTQVEANDLNKHINTSKNDIFEMIRKASFSSKKGENIVEFMFHVRKGTMYLSRNLVNLPYYNGINPRYFDGRTIEFKTLRDRSKLILDKMKKNNCVFGSWKKDCVNIEFKKG